jgi:hypothetical protein
MTTVLLMRRSKRAAGGVGGICATLALSRSARVCGCADAVTMARGRSIRRCRCHLSSTDTIGPHDTHSDLAITRPGRYYLCLRETVASAQKEDCSGDVVSVSIGTACQPSDCAIGEDCPRVKQSESITQCSATPAPSSRRAIRKHLSIASHIAMFQKMQRRPRDLQLSSSLRLTANFMRRGRGGLPHVPMMFLLLLVSISRFKKDRAYRA